MTYNPIGDRTNEPYIVCAAVKLADGLIICGPRHFDPTMRSILERLGGMEITKGHTQGFVDQRGKFYTREQAMKTAHAGGQVSDATMLMAPCKHLFSEDLY
jgi:hypothetical protein